MYVLRFDLRCVDVESEKLFCGLFFCFVTVPLSQEKMIKFFYTQMKWTNLALSRTASMFVYSLLIPSMSHVSALSFFCWKWTTVHWIYYYGLDYWRQG